MVLSNREVRVIKRAEEILEGLGLSENELTASQFIKYFSVGLTANVVGQWTTRFYKFNKLSIEKVQEGLYQAGIYDVNIMVAICQALDDEAEREKAEAERFRRNLWQRRL